MDRNIEKHELELLDIIREDDSFWWSIDGGSYKEIPQYLFDALKRYNIEKNKSLYYNLHLKRNILG